MSFYVTTPIYYVNDVPHLGHTYTTVAADALARFNRMCGVETFFLTGTDEHGQKIEQAAAKKGITPKSLADMVVERYYKLWKKLDITNDKFIRTTDEYHQKAVQAIFEKLQANGDIYEGEYEGWYCTPCEAFWTESQLREDNLCPDCGRPTAKMKEPTYFFRMSKYQDQLLQHIETHPNFIKPESRRNEIVSFIREGLRDLSVSRVTFSWGIKVPNDPKHVIYVWIDALANYLTALGYTSDDDRLYKAFWDGHVVQLVGKDILRFHTVYWPTMLMSLGLPLPETVFAHGWWTVEGQKMSKSLGNVVDPFYVTDKFGVDQVRYFLLREVTFGLDGDFSYKALIHRINGDLANDLGNLTTRTLGMITRYFNGKIPEAGEFDGAERAIHSLIEQTAKSYAEHMHDIAFNKALLSVWELVGALNRYIDAMQPWALAKDPQLSARLGTVLYTAVDGLRALSYFMAPFMPESAAKLRKQIGLSVDVKVGSASELGDFAKMVAGGTLGEVTALFPRIDEKEMMAAIAQDQVKDAPKPKEMAVASGEVEQIAMADFEKIRIIAGKVEAAERVAKSEKLLKLQVNDGVGVRTIVSGIAKSYEPQELVGKTVAILENLKPAKLMGIESRGMVLAAFDGERHHVVILPDTVPAGTKVK